MDDTRILSRERLDEIWARAHTVVAGGPHANAGDDLFALLAHSKALEAQRDHYHTEWTARGTALLQLHQDIDAERLKTTELTKEIGIASAELSAVNAMVMGETRRMWLNLDEESRSRLMQENPELAPMMSALTFITPTP